MLTFAQWMFICIGIIVVSYAFGFGIVVRRIDVPWYHLIGMAVSLLLFCSLFSMFGRWMESLFILRFFEVVTGFCLLLIGIALLYFPPFYPGKRDFGLLALALLVDMSLFGYRIGHYLDRSIALVVLGLLFLVLGFSAGMVTGQWRFYRWQHVKLYVPGILLALIGLLKMF